MKVYEDRSQMNLGDTWNLESIFKDQKDFYKEIEDVRNLLGEIDKYRGKLLSNADTFYESGELFNDIFRRMSKVGVYAHMKYDQDTRDSNSQALNDAAKKLMTETSAALSFIKPEILSGEKSQIDKILADPKNKIYSHYIDEMFRQKEHVLSPKEEEILAKMTLVKEAPSTIYSTLNNADLKFPSIKDEKGHEVQITHGNFIPFLESKDRRVRKDAFEALYKTYKGMENTFASTLDGDIKAYAVEAELRGFKSQREMSLNENAIPEKVYDNLIEGIHKHLPSMYKYMDIRKKLLNLDTLNMYDIYTPIIGDQDKVYTFEEAESMVKNSLKVMGDDYYKIVEEGFSSRWMDIYENTGKRSGAYSSGSYDTMPFILLNYHGTLDNVFTVAHELGHSIHSYYTRKYQPPIYGSYSIFLAEIASTCNEALLLDYLLKTAENDEIKKVLLVHYIESFRTTVFRQTMFAEFEHIIKTHAEKGGAINAEYLNGEYEKLNKLYYGPNMVINEEIKSEWARIPHFYYNYYVYQYATGYSAAQAFSKRIINGDTEAREKYINFLKSGCSDYPIEVLKKAGLDMTTTEPVDLALNKFDELVLELEKYAN